MKWEEYSGEENQEGGKETCSKPQLMEMTSRGSGGSFLHTGFRSPMIRLEPVRCLSILFSLIDFYVWVRFSFSWMKYASSKPPNKPPDNPSSAQPGPNVGQQSTKNVSSTRLKSKYLISRRGWGGWGGGAWCSMAESSFPHVLKSFLSTSSRVWALCADDRWHLLTCSILIWPYCIEVNKRRSRSEFYHYRCSK